MDIENINASAYCKNEILAEITFYKNKKLKTKSVKLLCSRLLARHRLKEKYDAHKVEEKQRSKDIDTVDEDLVKELITSDYKDKPLTNDKVQCSENNIGETYSSVLEQFKDLSTSESREYAEWYAYWEKHGENLVTETWMSQYGNCTTDELPMNVDDLYKKHCEQQYQMLYWKYVTNMKNSSKKIDDDYENYHSGRSSSSDSVDLNDIDNIPSFEFIYKYKNFDTINSKLIKAYKALSLIGFSYDDECSFEYAYVQYLKTNLIKSTRHLNVYRFPNMINGSKKCEAEEKSLNSHMDSENTSICYDNEKNGLSPLNNISKNNFETSGKKSKKSLKKEKFKQEKAKDLNEELERNGCSYLQNNPKLLKYWKKRHFLFSKFDKGIHLDEESWYSVTPEIISTYVAERCSCYLLVDAFCGAGGNTIQFAKTCELVIAIDIDPKKIEMARHNAELYGVSDRIQFIVGDYFALAPTLKADVVFLSPPWGGPDLMSRDDYKLCNIMAENGGGEYLLSSTRQITLDIAIHLPKMINVFDCIKSADNGYIEVQQNILNSRYNSITVYYNELYGLSSEETVEYEL